MKLNKIKSYKNWINWNINKKKPKIPHNSRTGEYAKNDDPSTWTTYEVAKNFAPCVGFEFSNVPVIGIDIDNCLDTKTGKMSELAKHVVEVMKSYTEISQSGTGLHILVFVDDKTGFKNHKRPLHEKGFDSQGIEFYKENCCIALTENSIKDFELENRQAETEKIYAEYFKHLDVEPVNIVHLDSNTAGYMPDDLDEIAFNAMMSKPKNKALWEGEHSVYPSQSEADLAFCGLLAWYFNEDARKMDFYFRKSGLMREKWDRPQKNGTYGEVVISKAIAGNNGCYNAELFSEQGRILFSFAVAKLLNNSFDTALELFKKKAAETVSDETAKLIWANAQNSHAYQSQKRLQEKLTSDNGNKELVITDETLEKHSENELITLASKYDVVKVESGKKTDNFAHQLFENGIYFDYDNKDGIEFLVDKLIKECPIKGRISKEKRQANEQNVKDFVRQLKKFCETDEDLLNDCIAKLKINYGANYIEKMCKAPSKKDLAERTAKDFCNKNVVIASGNPGKNDYFVYDKKLGNMENIDRGDMLKLIRDTYSVQHDFSEAISKEIYSLSKEKSKNLKFNEYNGFNLLNGVFDFEQQKLIPHSPDFRFTFTTDFAYDPNAWSYLFEETIKEACNNVPGRIQCFNDMLGHIVLSKLIMKEQFFFLLYGEKGSNGKSTLMDTIAEIFKDVSSSVPPEKMGDNNEVIELEGSILNYVADCDCVVSKPACAAIKRATGGDLLRGNKKYNDVRHFRTRATFVYSFNDVPQFKTHDEGLIRRMVFIKFEKQFTNAKGNMNKNLKNELLRNKPGIFNYMIRCALNLMENNCNVRIYKPDNTELIKEFKEENDCVAAFVADCPEKIQGQRLKSELYESFSEYCRQRNLKEIPRIKKFGKEIKKLITNAKDFTSNGFKYWVFENEPESVPEPEPQIVEAESVKHVQPASEKEQGEIFYFMTRIYVNAVDNNAVEYDDKLLKAVAGLKSLNKIKEVVERLKNEATTENEKKFYEACLTDVKNAKKKIA